MSSEKLEQWSLSRDAWRVAPRLSQRTVNMALRFGGWNRLPAFSLARVNSLGIPPEVVQETIRSIRSLDSWSDAWVETAQHFLGLSRRETSAGNRPEAEAARSTASMCYHAAQVMELRNSIVRDRCRSWASRLHTLALPVTAPNARHLLIPCRDLELPALFQAPEQGSGPFGLVVLLNGLSMCKEETFRWRGRFLFAGFAVLAVDSPGTGEATNLGPITVANPYLMDGIRHVFAGEPSIDLTSVVVAGVSLGGNEAVQLAARDRRLMAAISVTGAFQPSRWLGHSSPMLRRELSLALGQEVDHVSLPSIDLAEHVDSVTQPVLVMGAARDMVIPPNESQLLAEALGERATLLWYPELGHGLYAAMDQWTQQAATWLAAIRDARYDGVGDAAHLANMGEQAILSTPLQPAELLDIDLEDDSIEYARVISPSSARD